MPPAVARLVRFSADQAVTTAAHMLARRDNYSQPCECSLRFLPKGNAGLLASSLDGQPAAGGGMPASDREMHAGPLLGRTADPQDGVCSACRWVDNRTAHAVYSWSNRPSENVNRRQTNYGHWQD